MSDSDVITDSVHLERKDKTSVIFEADINSDESEGTPMSQWSSLIFYVQEENKKRLLAEEGLYDPGSKEICYKYIAVSNSEILRHPYYPYPEVLDPGIQEALKKSDPIKTYNEDGQDIYLDTCKEMGICPVKEFHRNLVDRHINLKYYGVNPIGVRAMCIALKRNPNVESIDFTDNWLSEDACYHIGALLLENRVLKDINLKGCRIGPQGVKRLCVNILYNDTLRSLNLSYNNLGDVGMEILGEYISENHALQKLNLAHNNMGTRAAAALAAAIEFTRLTHLDLSWNMMFHASTVANFIARTADSLVLQELNISWNGMSELVIARAIKLLMKVPTLRVLDISNNRFTGDTIKPIVIWLNKASKLHTLNMSGNPLKPQDSLMVLTKMKLNKVKVQELLLDNCLVNREFLELREEVLRMKSRAKAVITYGTVIGDYEIHGPDMREVLLKRAAFLSAKAKKKKIDFGLFIMTLHAEGYNIVNTKEVSDIFKYNGLPRIDEDLVEELGNAFPGPRSAKGGKTMIFADVVEYIRRLWPETRLPTPKPPTPPPTPPPPKNEKQPKPKGRKKK